MVDFREMLIWQRMWDAILDEDKNVDLPQTFRDEVAARITQGGKRSVKDNTFFSSIIKSCAKVAINYVNELAPEEGSPAPSTCVKPKGRFKIKKKSKRMYMIGVESNDSQGALDSMLAGPTPNLEEMLNWSPDTHMGKIFYSTLDPVTQLLGLYENEVTWDAPHLIYTWHFMNGWEEIDIKI